MKKILTISLIILLVMFILNIGIVNAATGTASFTASSTSVKPGETFKVTLSANSDDGLNSVDTTYSYDTDKLEFVSANVANSNWSSLGQDNQITVISNSTSKITSNDVYVLTFKVKDTATVGTTAKISTSEVMIDTDLATDSSLTVSAKSVNINIVSVDDNKGNTNTDDEPNTPSEGTNTNKISSNNIQSESPTTANKILPKTGEGFIILITSIAVIVLGILSFVLYRRYRNV